MPLTDRPWQGLPRHAEVIERLARAVAAGDHWRWLEVSCSLAAGRGDELSDVDVGVGYGDGVEPGELAAAGARLVAAAGTTVDLLVHVLPGWPQETRRVAAEYTNGVQLDLVLMPARRRKGLPEGSVAVVDKDDQLAQPWRPPVADPPTVEQAREWVMLGWWAISDVAKHVQRGALYEAVERLAEARQEAFRLHAVAARIPYPSFGLVSLLDFPPFEVPAVFGDTYCVPERRSVVLRAADVTAGLLGRASEAAAVALGAGIETPWAGAARRRLDAVRRNVPPG